MILVRLFMEKPRYKFSLKVFAVGILLLGSGGAGAFYQYLRLQEHYRLNLTWLLLLLFLLILGGAVVIQAFRSGVKTLQISMPLAMAQKAKQAVESSDPSVYKTLLKGEKVEWPCAEYVALSVEKFPDQPHLATVQYLHKKAHPTGSFYEDIDATKRVTVEAAVVQVIDQLAEHYGYFNSY